MKLRGLQRFTTSKIYIHKTPRERERGKKVTFGGLIYHLMTLFHYEGLRDQWLLEFGIFTQLWLFQLDACTILHSA